LTISFSSIRFKSTRSCKGLVFISLDLHSYEAASSTGSTRLPD
jgi:hypothetical protein